MEQNIDKVTKIVIVAIIAMVVVSIILAFIRSEKKNVSAIQIDPQKCILVLGDQFTVDDKSTARAVYVQCLK